MREGSMDGALLSEPDKQRRRIDAKDFCRLRGGDFGRHWLEWSTGNTLDERQDAVVLMRWVARMRS